MGFHGVGACAIEAGIALASKRKILCLQIIQFRDSILHYIRIAFDLFLGVAAGAETIANLFLAELRESLPDPLGVRARNMLGNRFHGGTFAIVGDINCGNEKRAAMQHEIHVITSDLVDKF